MEKVRVTVLCLVYNHEKYLRRCLDGFVSQKTNFKFEVIVHDDASTDSSAEIIREYEENYPEIIKPIYQIENQYSKGKKITKEFILPVIKGDYLANCEGDDYWLDPYKLQKQFDFLESNPDYSCCVHSAVYRTKKSDGTFSDRVVPAISNPVDISLEEAILYGGDLIATNSMFRRAELLFTQPDCFLAKGFGDYQAIMYSTIFGKVHCFDEIMSVYNCGTEGSWTQRVWNNPQKRIAHYAEEIRMLNAVDEYYDFKYHSIINDKIENTKYQLYLFEKNKKMLKSEPYRNRYLSMKKINRKEKFLSSINILFPWLRRLKRRINR